MARKKGDDVDFDDFDFDNFDDGGDGGFDSPEVRDDRKPITKIAGGFKDGLTDHLKNPRNQVAFAKQVLPSGYGRALDAGDQIISGSRELYDHTLKEAAPVLKDVKKLLQMVVPKESAFLPKKWTEAIHKALEERDERRVSEEEMEETAIASEMAGIFKQQEEKQDAQYAQQEAKQDVRHALQMKSSQGMIEQLMGVRIATERLVGYQDQVTVNYQRKSLELQYRTFFVQRRHLDAFQKYAGKTDAQLDAIAKNTAMPEEVKVENSEMAARLLKERLFTSIQDWSSGLGRRALTNAKREVTNFFQSFGGNLQMAMMGIETARDMAQFAPGGAHAMAGNTLGGMAAAAIAKRLAKPVREMVGKNEFLQKGNSKLTYLMDMAPNWFNDFLSGRHDDGFNPIKDFVRGIFGPSYRRDSMVMQGEGLANLDQATHMRQLTRRTIEEVIPGWLSKIHGELRTMRTGSTDVDELIYDFEKSDFTTVDQRVAAIKQKIGERTNLKDVHKNARAIVKKIIGDEVLDKKAYKVLFQAVLKNAKEERMFDPRDYVELPNGVGDMIKARFNLEEEEFEGYGPTRYKFNPLSQSSENINTFNEINLLSKDLRYRLPDAREILSHEAKYYGSKASKKMGLITQQGGSQYANEDAVLKMLYNRQFKTDGEYSAIDTRLAGMYNPVQGAPVVNIIQPTPPPSSPQRPPGYGQPGYGGQQMGGGYGGAGGQMHGSQSGGGGYIVDEHGRRHPIAGGPGMSAPSPMPPPPSPTGAPTPGISVFDMALSTRTINQQLQQLEDNLTKAIIEGRDPATDKSNDQLMAELLLSIDDTLKNGLANELLISIDDTLKKGMAVNIEGMPGAPGQAGPMHWADRSIHGILDIGKGLKNFGTRQWRKGGIMTRRLTRKLGKGFDWMGKQINKTIDYYNDTDFKDIFVRGKEKALLTAKGIKSGEYIDQVTGKVITKLDDIKGPVVDKMGNIILSAEEFAEGLFDRDGRPVLAKVTGVIKGAWEKLKGLSKPVDTAFRWMKDVARSVMDFAKAYKDVYVKGETEPRILARLVRQGYYRYRDTGVRLADISKINGVIVDPENKVVLSTDDINKGLVDQDGNPILGMSDKLVNLGKGLFDKAVSGGKKVWKWAGEAAQKTKDTLSDAWGWMKGKMTGTTGVPFFNNTGGMSMFGGGSQRPVVGALKAIYLLLNRRMPGTPESDGDIDNIFNSIMPPRQPGEPLSVSLKGIGQSLKNAGKAIKDKLVQGKNWMVSKLWGATPGAIDTYEKLKENMISKYKLTRERADELVAELKAKHGDDVRSAQRELQALKEKAGKKLSKLWKQTRGGVGRGIRGIGGLFRRRQVDPAIAAHIALFNGTYTPEMGRTPNREYDERQAMYEKMFGSRVGGTSIEGADETHPDVAQYLANQREEARYNDWLKTHARHPSDVDGDGDREGSWQDRQQEERIKAEQEAKMAEERKQTSLLSKLTGLFGRKKKEEAEDTSWFGSLLSNFGLGFLAKPFMAVADKIGNSGLGAILGGIAGKVVETVGNAVGGLTGLMGRGVGALMGSRAAGLLVRGGTAVAGMAAKAGTAALSLGGAALNTAMGVGGVLAGKALAGVGILGKGLLAVISAPATLAIAAVAGAGYVGYQMFKNFKKRDQYLTKFRYAQYGYDPGTMFTDGDDEEIEAIQKLEAMLLPHISYDAAGKARINPGNIMVEDMLTPFDINKEDPYEVQTWIAWFGYRFKPIFLSHLTVLNRIAKGKATLNEIDDKLNTDQRLEYLKGVHFPLQEGPYVVAEGPFPTNWYGLGLTSQTVNLDAEDIQEYYDDYMDDIEGARGKDKDKMLSDKASGDAKEEAKPTSFGAKLFNLKESIIGGVKDIAGKIGNWMSSLSTVADSYESKWANKLGVTNPVGKFFLGLVAKPVALEIGLKAMAFGQGNNIFTKDSNFFKTLKDGEYQLTKFRFYQYGFSITDFEEIEKIGALEALLIPHVTYGATGAVIQQHEALDSIPDIFGVDMEDDDEMRNFLMWFEGRFKPVFLSHMTAINNVARGTPLHEVDTKLKAVQRIEILKVVHFADGGPYYVTQSPFPTSWYEFWADSTIDVSVADIEKAYKRYMSELEDQSKKDTYENKSKGKETAPKDDNDKDKTKDVDKSLWTKTTDYWKDKWDKTTERLKNIYEEAKKNVADVLSPAWNKAKEMGKNVMGFLGSVAKEHGGWLADAGSYLGTAAAKYVAKKGDAKKNEQAMIDAMIAAGITDPKEQAMLMAQVDHESGHFGTVEENLNYKVDNLMKISATARSKGVAAVTQAVRGGPAAIAELMYGGRMGNDQPGDGFRYRGRGFIQLTGKDNYAAASAAVGIDLVKNPDLAAHPENAAKIALWYWKNRVGAAGKSGDVAAVTKKINGGTIGLKDREELYAGYLKKTTAGELKASGNLKPADTAPSGTDKAPAGSMVAETTAPTPTKETAKPTPTAAPPAPTPTPTVSKADAAKAVVTAAAPAAVVTAAAAPPKVEPVPDTGMMKVSYGSPEQMEANKQREAMQAAQMEVQRTTTAAKTEASLQGVVDVMSRQLMLQATHLPNMDQSLQTIVAILQKGDEERGKEDKSKIQPPVQPTNRIAGAPSYRAPPVSMGKT